MARTVVEHEYRPKGPASAIFRLTVPEFVLAGPANTGKSFAIAHYLLWRAEMNPGCRILVARKTRKSLSESWINTFENKVVPIGHPITERPISVDHRTHYQFTNGSRIVLGGLDNATRFYSTEWDCVYVNEARELNEGEWEEFWRGLRNKKILHPDGGIDPKTKGPRYLHQLIGDTNPDAPGHWLKKREKAGKLVMLEQLHIHNPAITDDDIERLKALTGVRRQRLYEGRWVSAEGAIWPDWNPDIHIIDKLEKGRIIGYFGSIDWGFSAPGCMGVWGVDSENRMYLVAQVYRAQMSDDWWLEVANELTDEFNMQVWVADPEDAGAIAKFRRAGLPIHEAQKRVAAGLDAVRDRLRVEHDGLPRLMVVRDNLRRGRCQVCVESKWATCLEEEIPEYVYMPYEAGKEIKEVPANGQADHGADMARYACMHANVIDFRKAPKPADLHPLSIGAQEGYAEIMRRSRLGLPQNAAERSRRRR